MAQLRSAIFVLLLVAACSADEDSPVRNAAQEPTGANAVPERVVGPMRVSPERVRELTTKAKGGNIGAMHSLAAHHITAGEKVESRYWLAEAVKHGDCHAVQLLLENTYFEVPPKELPHWRGEAKRLGCDPAGTYLREREKPAASSG